MGGGGDVEGSRRARARCLLQRHPVLSAGNELLRGLRANAMDYSSLNEIFLVNYSLEPKLSNEKDVLEELITVSVEIQAHLSCVGLMAECCPDLLSRWQQRRAVGLSPTVRTRHGSEVQQGKTRNEQHKRSVCTAHG